MATHVASVTRNTSQIDAKWTPPEFDASASNIVLAITLIIIDLITLFGNGLVLLAFAVNRHLFQPFNMFIFNLAVTDFFVAITAMTFYTIDTLLGYWPFGYVMCCVWIFFDFAMTFASVFTVVAISVDRFWCVTWAIHYKVNNNKTKTWIILGLVWLCVFIIWTPPFIYDRLKQTDDKVCIWKPSENKEFVIFVAIIGHYLPCSIMVFCYLKVLFVMRRQSAIVATNHTRSLQTYSSQVGGNPGTSRDATTTHSLGNTDNSRATQNPPTKESDFTNTQSASGVEMRSGQHHSGRRTSIGTSRNSANNQAREKKIFITLTYVLGSYLICWFPFYIAFDTYAWKPELIPNQLYTFFFWMTYVNSTLNPLIYAYTSKDFRSAFVKTLACVYRCKM